VGSRGVAMFVLRANWDTHLVFSLKLSRDFLNLRSPVKRFTRLVCRAAI
jgi:hypothetical protein